MSRAGFRLLRTQAFRIVLVYVLLFAVSVSALLFFTYWNTRRTLDAQTDQIVEAEITGLSEQWQRLGLRGLAESVMSRSLHGGQALYLLTDGAHRPIAGNLNGWPAIKPDAGNFVEFEYERGLNGMPEPRRARGRSQPRALRGLGHRPATPGLRHRHLLLAPPYQGRVSFRRESYRRVAAPSPAASLSGSAGGESLC